MRRPKNVGRLIAIGTIALALFVAIMFVILFNQWLNGDKGNVEFIAKVDEIEEAQKKNFYENWWDRKIVVEILENEVPVPEGFEFVSGTKDTGIIIKDKETNAELMWIPYDENAKVEGIEEYYKNVEYKYIDSETIESIEKYGGFYVTLEEQNQYEALKQVDDASYKEAIKQANKLYENKESVNSHLVSLTELEQIITFANKNGMEIVQTKLNEKNEYKVDKLLSINSTVTKIDNTNRALGLISVPIEVSSGTTYQETVGSNGIIAQNLQVNNKGEKKQVPIPNGYYYYIMKDSFNNIEVVKITDIENPNLSYIWVPVNEKESASTLGNARRELNNKYSELNVRNNWPEAKDPTDSEEYQELLKSVRQYGGFYIGEAELGYGNEGQIYNQARGMEEGLVSEGEYYRYTALNGKKEAVTGKSGLEKDENGYHLTYEKAKEIASSIKNSAGSTVSHLTYGAEWDVTMLWIMKNNSNLTTENLSVEQGIIQDSTQMLGCKYAGKMDGVEDGILKTENIKKINGIYGLAGNLCDITQEYEQEGEKTYRILRGGSYSTAGNESPMAARQKVESVDSTDIGFRNCLYIVPEELNEKTRVFDFSTDSYAFLNATEYFVTKNDYYNNARGHYLSDKWVQALIKDLSNTKKQEIVNIVNSPFMGACYGMSVTSGLLKNNILTTNYWQSGANNVRSLEIPIKSQNILNLIEFYQFSQLRPEITKNDDFYSKIDLTKNWDDSCFNADDDNIQRLINGLTSNPDSEYLVSIVLLERGNRHSTHALLAYNIEPLYGKNGYSYKVDVYDSNWDEPKILYITTDLYIEYEGLWRTAEQKNEISEYNGRKAIAVMAAVDVKDLDIINPEKLDFLNEQKLDEYINSPVTNYRPAQMRTGRISNIWNEVKISNESGDLTITKDGIINKNMPIAILPNYDSYEDYNNYVQFLLNDEKEYIVETKAGDNNVNAEFMFEDTYQVVNANGGAITKFSEDGNVTISNNANGKYNIQITSNNTNANMEWGTVEIKGQGANEVSVTRTEEGILINSDNIENVLVQAKESGANKVVKAEISTKANSAIIRTEKDQNEESSMYIYTDLDEDGEYENKEKLNLVEENVQYEAKIETQENNANYNKTILVVIVAVVMLVVCAIITIKVKKNV